MQGKECLVQTVLKQQIVIILISYIIIKLLINENHTGRNRKRNSIVNDDSWVVKLIDNLPSP